MFIGACRLEGKEDKGVRVLAAVTDISEHPLQGEIDDL
jgi:hypothetical protein